MRVQNGYTLLEIMIALFVFAILATITSSALYQAFDTRARVNVQADQLNSVQLAMTLIERDTTQTIERAIRGNEMHTFPPFIGQPHYVEFTRGGMVNPNGIEQRSTLKRVALICKNRTLIRRSWESLDTPHRDQYQDRIILDNLEQCNFAYINKSRQVLTEWRAYALTQNQSQESIPIAIQCNFTLRGLGNMSLLFPLPEGIYDIT